MSIVQLSPLQINSATFKKSSIHKCHNFSLWYCDNCKYFTIVAILHQKYVTIVKESGILSISLTFVTILSLNTATVVYYDRMTLILGIKLPIDHGWLLNEKLIGVVYLRISMWNVVKHHEILCINYLKPYLAEHLNLVDFPGECCMWDLSYVHV